MAIQPIPNFSLQSYQHETVQSLNKKISFLSIKAFAARTLAKIAFVALVAMTALVFYRALSTRNLSYSTVQTTLFSSTLVRAGTSWLSSKAKEYEYEAKCTQALSNGLQQVTLWDDDTIQSFINQYDLDISVDCVKQHRPLVALFRSLHPGDTLPPVAPAEGTFVEKRAAYYKDYARFEEETIPRALQAAVVLQFMKYPDQNIDIIPFDLTLPGIGICQPKNCGDRDVDRQKLDDDDYFLFDIEPKKPLRLDQIEGAKPEELRKLLFPENPLGVNQ